MVEDHFGLWDNRLSRDCLVIRIGIVLRSKVLPDSFWSFYNRYCLIMINSGQKKPWATSLSSDTTNRMKKVNSAFNDLVWRSHLILLVNNAVVFSFILCDFDFFLRGDERVLLLLKTSLRVLLLLELWLFGWDLIVTSAWSRASRSESQHCVLWRELGGCPYRLILFFRSFIRTGHSIALLAHLHVIKLLHEEFAMETLRRSMDLLMWVAVWLPLLAVYKAFYGL